MRIKKNEEELSQLGLKTLEVLKEFLTPLIKPCTKINVKKATEPPENSQLISQFGGQPYFETGENWPQTESGKHLDFIFQIFNCPDFELPDSIALVQCYYNWDEYPWNTNVDGWFVKIYKNLSKEKMIFVEQPQKPGISEYCEVEMVSCKSLPDWEGIDLYCPEISKLASILDSDTTWKIYDDVVTKLIGEQNHHSHLGGYPNWIQNESTPKNKNGDKMKLLFQIDSEGNAGIMWGDIGVAYVFYDEESEKVWFTFQCH